MGGTQHPPRTPRTAPILWPEVCLEPPTWGQGKETTKKSPQVLGAVSCPAGVARPVTVSPAQLVVLGPGTCPVTQCV